MHKHPCVVVLNFIKLFPITLINSYTNSSHHTCMRSIFFSEHFLTIKVIKKIISSHLDQWCTTTDWTWKGKQFILYYHSAFVKMFFVIFKANILFPCKYLLGSQFRKENMISPGWKYDLLLVTISNFVWEVLKGENVRKSPTNVPSRLSTLRVLLISVLKIKILFVLANR